MNLADSWRHGRKDVQKSSCNCSSMHESAIETVLVLLKLACLVSFSAVDKFQTGKSGLMLEATGSEQENHVSSTSQGFETSW